ncbi:glycosyltransferase involved in cell wall biosynthesis/SAM-dependent methyltransferase [Variovorax sp. GrIS 2.14]|uniref:glycosyltransferase n=1 Tax=Variovorax sp. GrIS 2.14 TaxID=3071709 RepID=UPI0038F6A108
MESSDFYTAFEMRCRGTRELITSRLTAYRPFLEPVLVLESTPKLLDLGCGRGEWIELAAEWGFDASGVDINKGMLAFCRNLGLQVEQADALHTLRQLGDASVWVVSAFHVVEHIPFDDVRTLISEAMRVLKPGGLLIMETPNPENLVVGATTFYLDPTHVRPIPPVLLSFATEFAGFLQNKIVRLQESQPAESALRLNDVLNGVSPDYSVVAQKSAPIEVLALFSGPFDHEFGTSLERMVHRYDSAADGIIDRAGAVESRVDQIIDRADAVENRVDQVEEDLVGVKAGAEQTVERLRAAEERAQRAIAGQHKAQIEMRQSRARSELAEALAGKAANDAAAFQARAEHAEQAAALVSKQAVIASQQAAAASQQAAAASQRVDAMLQSTSWQVSAPLRWMGKPAARMKSAFKEKRVRSGLKRRAKGPLRSLAVGLAASPRLQHTVSKALTLVPNLKQRLGGALAPPPVAGEPVEAPAVMPPAETKAATQGNVIVGGRYEGKRVAVLAPTSSTQEKGGAERLFQGLANALRHQGCVVDEIQKVVDESTFEGIQAGYQAFEALDLGCYDMVISTKAPSYAARHPNHVLWLVHTVRVFYDMFDLTFPSADEHVRTQRDWIVRADTEALGRIAQRFSIGNEVSRRLRLWNELDASVMHPPMEEIGFFNQGDGGYFFIPGRLHRWKRLDLLIMAVTSSSLPLRLIIAGTGEAEHSLKALAGGDTRIEFAGRVSDERLKELYASCLAVPFLPVREDYGYVTLEAFASSKPVITCSDSGEPAHFVEDGQTGFVCAPDIGSVRHALERMWNDRKLAARMGNAARQRTAGIQWPITAKRLLQAGLDRPDPKRLRVAILDMQPIIPAVGGGRLRLLGLYHALGEGIDARYVGTYDWPGENYRRHQITPGLEETDVPLSVEHHAAAAEAALQAGGRVVIDMVFGRQAHLSPEYLAETLEAVEWADVVVFSHPWVAPLVDDGLLAGKTVVYDSHNVERDLRAQILNLDAPFERDILMEVEAAERTAGDRAHMILACSDEDAKGFESAYGWSRARMQSMPNGVFADAIQPPTPHQRDAARENLQISHDAKVVFFIGSNYDPNVEAGRLIAGVFAAQLPDVQFVIAGGVCTRLIEIASNVRLAGMIDDVQKLLWLHAADLAVNPMLSGSGTNIKMFDFMAAGLPVIATPMGARGIASKETSGLRVVEVDAMVSNIAMLLAEPEERRAMGECNRELVEQRFAWERISPRLGMRLRSMHLRTRGIAELNAFGQKRVVAHFGTIGIRCGIGEYARKLIEIFTAHGVRNHVLTCDSAEEEAVIPSGVVDARIGWYYDNHEWALSHIKSTAVSSLIEWGAEGVLIHYHPAYYSPAMLCAFGQDCLNHGIAVAVVMHQCPPESFPHLKQLAAEGATLFSHSEREVSAAREQGVVLSLLPLGIDFDAHPVRDISQRDWTAQPPVIVTNGFLREHKGARRLIEAMPEILKAFPSATLRVQCSLYPSEDSRREADACEQAVKRLELGDRVVIDTRFLDKRDVLSEISKGDIVMLPYDQSIEGGSASAGDALGLSLPIIASAAHVFDDIRNVVITTGIDSPSLARAAIGILRDPALYLKLSQTSSTYAKENSWNNVAGAFLSALTSVKAPVNLSTQT